MRLQYLPSNERHLPDTFTIPTRITHKHVRTIISVKYLSITRLHPFITPSITSSSDAYTHSHNKSIRNTQKENHFFFLVVKLVLSWLSKWNHILQLRRRGIFICKWLDIYLTPPVVIHILIRFVKRRRDRLKQGIKCRALFPPSLRTLHNDEFIEPLLSLSSLTYP